MTIEEQKELYEYVLNKVNQLDRQIAKLQGMRDAYAQIEMDLCYEIIEEREIEE